MKVAVLALCVAAVLSNESVNLDEGTTLVQETAGIDAGMSAKTGVKVTDAAKAKVGGQNKARATVMIGTHELDAEEVEMAKSHLQKITMKLGARHPYLPWRVCTDCRLHPGGDRGAVRQG